MHGCLELLIAFMNHFPLFVLMLRVKDPARLPGGVGFVPTRGSTIFLQVSGRVGYIP
jgi:phosphatidylinositol glycan class Q protein